MQTKPYEKQLPVKLTPEEIVRRREKQALESPLALEAHAELVADEASAWDTAKANRKAREKELEGKGKGLLANLYREARVLRDGVELRDVECEDVIVGVMLHVRRLDTGDQVGEARRASPMELEAWEEAHPATQPTKPGATPEEREEKLVRVLCEALMPNGKSKPRGEPWIKARLKQGCPEASDLERDLFLGKQLDVRVTRGEDDKLCWIGHVPAAPATKDDGIVADDYQPSDPAPVH